MILVLNNSTNHKSNQPTNQPTKIFNHLYTPKLISWKIHLRMVCMCVSLTLWKELSYLMERPKFFYQINKYYFKLNYPQVLNQKKLKLSEWKLVTKYTVENLFFINCCQFFSFQQKCWCLCKESYCCFYCFFFIRTLLIDINRKFNGIVLRKVCCSISLNFWQVVPKHFSDSHSFGSKTTPWCNHPHYT